MKRTDAPTQIDDDELVPEDDRVIGRALRWSLWVAVVGALIVTGVLLWSREDGRAVVVVPKELGKVAENIPDAALLPQVVFTDITRSAGIDFVHENGATGRRLLPETMGGGVAFFDYDNDHDADLLFVNSDHWPTDGAVESHPTTRLFQNDGRGQFRDVSAECGLNLSCYGMGAACGDFDGDGWTDVFITALGPNHLLRNVGGRFEDVTASAGVAGAPDEWSTSAGFFDFDNDADLDLFVCNYVHWSEELDLKLNFSMNGRDRAYGPPTQYTGTFPYLYRNDGGGKFTDVSAAAGVQVQNAATGAPTAKSLGVCFVDFDRDGRIDIAVANDTVQKFLFHNRGDGTFAEIGAVSGMGFDSTGRATGAMGIDIADYRANGSLGIAVGNFANEMTSLYVSQKSALQFTDEAIGEGIGAPSRSRLTFGVLFLDYDLDGRLDFLQANGHIEDSIHDVQASQTYEQPAQLFWNGGPARRACFVEVPKDKLAALAEPIVGRGAAHADIDGDGDQDVIFTQAGRAPLLVRNDQALGHHWLRVRLVGKQQREAIGAWVELTTAAGKQRLQVMPTRSYLAQVELPLTFGLGRATSIEALDVSWPSGTRERFAPPTETDREVVLEEGAGTR